MIFNKSCKCFGVFGVGGFEFKGNSLPTKKDESFKIKFQLHINITNKPQGEGIPGKNGGQFSKGCLWLGDISDKIRDWYGCLFSGVNSC